MHDLPSLPRPRVLALIPAHNEAASIAAVVRGCHALPGLSVTVVCDACSDGTAHVARSAGARVIELPVQLGAWGATQAGLRDAQRAGIECVVTLDGDGQHDPASLTCLLAEMARAGTDVVIGTCPGRLSLAKRIAWGWFRALTGLSASDLTSGLRVYGRRAIDVLASEDATLLDYQDVGVLLLLRERGLSIAEVPVTMAPRTDGHSRVFTSWRRVAAYMVQTTVLCLARAGRRRAPG